jgi:hypothetical protein
VRKEFATQEALDDQKYGALSDTSPNQDESNMKNDLDLKMLNPNPQTSVILDQAQVTTAI